MAGYRFRSRRSYRRYGWYSKSRSSRRRALGNSRAARAQRDNATVVINRISSFPITVTGSANAYFGTTVINHWNELRQSQFFPNYAPMYDQVKIDKIRVKITGSQAGSAMTANISPAVVAAFDRNGLDANQTITSTTISTYSSAQLKQWSTGNSFVMYQTIYPSSIMEKGQYIPTNSLQDPATSPGNVSSNPCNNLSDPTLPFKPLTLLGVDMGGVSASASQVFAFTIEFEYTVTFRGMRKPSLNYSDVSSPLDVNVTDSDVINGELYFDDGPYNPVSVSLSNITPQPQYITFQDTITQNGRYVSSVPNGQAVKSVDITVQVPTTSSFVIAGIRIDPTSDFIPLTDFTYASTNQSITVNRNQLCIYFANQSTPGDPDGYYYYGFYIDSPYNSTNYSITQGSYYYVASDTTPDQYIHLCDSNQNIILDIGLFSYYELSQGQARVQRVYFRNSSLKFQ
nr:MAG: putative capsid protein [Canine stool-associated circular virus]